jgi:hypothetical protein
MDKRIRQSETKNLTNFHQKVWKFGFRRLSQQFKKLKNNQSLFLNSSNNW